MKYELDGFEIPVDIVPYLLAMFQDNSGWPHFLSLLEKEIESIREVSEGRILSDSAAIAHDNFNRGQLSVLKKLVSLPSELFSANLDGTSLFDDLGEDISDSFGE